MVGGQDVFLWRLDRDNAELEHRATLLRGPFQGLAALRPLVERSNALLIEAARALDEDAEVVLPAYLGKDTAVPRSFVLVHALYHGVEHRGQVCTTLTQIGVTPPDLDGWGYAADAGIGGDLPGDAPRAAGPARGHYHGPHHPAGGAA